MTLRREIFSRRDTDRITLIAKDRSGVLRRIDDTDMERALERMKKALRELFG